MFVFVCFLRGGILGSSKLFFVAGGDGENWGRKL